MNADLIGAIAYGRKQAALYPAATPAEIERIAATRAIEYGKDWANAWLQGVKAEIAAPTLKPLAKVA
jgi:hypothetical protein